MTPTPKKNISPITGTITPASSNPVVLIEPRLVKTVPASVENTKRAMATPIILPVAPIL